MQALNPAKNFLQFLLLLISHLSKTKGCKLLV